MGEGGTDKLNNVILLPIITWGWGGWKYLDNLLDTLDNLDTLDTFDTLDTLDTLNNVILLPHYYMGGTEIPR